MNTLAVVVPTHNRADRLERLLQALAAQQDGDFELVVVDDGSSDRTPEVLAGSGVHVIRHPVPQGPAAARNAGWRASSAALVAFTDDDCVPQPGWTRALRAAAGDGACVVQGRTLPDPAERAAHPGAFARTLAVVAETPFHPTCNILYPRALLEALGGFDEAFPFPAGEDTDLGWRATGRGARVVFAPDAVVHHAVHALGPLGLARGAAKWHTTVRVVKRHPGVRRHLHHRVFWKPAHERLLLSALLVAASPRRPLLWPLAAVLYAEVHRLEHGSWPGTLAKLPAHLLIDAAEVAALVRGSVQARSLLL